jgi:hypothetical protein
MDLKTAGEAVGLLGTLKEVKDKFTGKAEIKDLQAQLAEKDQRLAAANVGLDAFGLSSEDLAIIGISVVAIVAIIAIAVVLVKYQPAMIQT